MTEQIASFTKDKIIPISISMLLFLGGGMYSLTYAIFQANQTLTQLSRDQWTIQMMESYATASERMNNGHTAPDVMVIKNRYDR